MTDRPSQKTDHWGGNVTVSWQIKPDTMLKSITAYRDLTTDSYIDIDATTLELGDVLVALDQNQFSQEFQLLYNSERMSLVAGLYYIDAEASNDFDVVLGNAGATAYTASRWALRGLHEALRQDLRGTGVTSSLIYFGEVSSEYFEANPDSHEHIPSLGSWIPVSTPERCAEVILGVVRRPRAVVFHPLAREQIRAIAEIQIDYLKRRLAEREITLELTTEALDHLGEAGFDPVYGARPLKRAIRQQLENALAQEILAGRFPPGSSVRVELAGEELRFVS